MSRPRKYPEELLERGVAAGAGERPADRACRGRSGHPPGDVAQAGAPGRGRRRACGRICRRARSARRSSGCAQENFELRRANEILKSGVGVFREGARRRPTEVSRYIDEHRGRFGVEPICRTLGVSASAYYQRAQRPALGARGRGRAAARADPGAARGQLLRLRLPADVEGAAARRRAGRPRRVQAADAQPRRSWARSGAASRGGPPSPDPQAARRPGSRPARLHAPRGPNELWVADLTYLRCWEGLVFFAFVLDAYSRDDRRLAARRPHAHRPRPRRAADGAPPPRPGADVELIHHSDAAASTPASTTPRRSTTTACSPRSDPSATPTTTRSPNLRRLLKGSLGIDVVSVTVK